MIKEILIILASFSLLSAEDQAVVSPNIQSKTYSVEGKYEGKDGTFYYKAQQVEIVAMQAGNAEQKQSNSVPTPPQERQDLVTHESTYNKDQRIDKRPYAERKDFVNNELPATLFLTGVGEPNQTIDWMYGNKNTDISFGFISNELYMYKTTTYVMVVKPKPVADSSTTSTTKIYNV